MQSVTPVLITDKHDLPTYLKTHNPQRVNLHLGCGGERWHDFINVDLYDVSEEHPDRSRSGCDVDAVADMRDLGLPEDSIDEIFSAHTLEHFTRWEACSMLADWLRMLKPGGKIILETPDFRRCILRLFHWRRRHRQLARNMFYGNQWDGHDFETHRYVWSAREIRSELLSIGYTKVNVSHNTLTHVPGRDMRIVAVK